MTYKSILVNIDIDRPAGNLIMFASEFAARFDAHLIGFAAADIPPPPASAEGMIFDGEIMREQAEEIERRLEKLKTDFHALAGSGHDREWRGAIGNPTRLLAEAARAADLIITQSPDGASSGSTYRCVDLGSLVLQTGRPVLIAAGGCGPDAFQKGPDRLERHARSTARRCRRHSFVGADVGNPCDKGRK
jgi:nucleotide-binding universal stress UspA family protein